MQENPHDRLIDFIDDAMRVVTFRADVRHEGSERSSRWGIAGFARLWRMSSQEAAARLGAEDWGRRFGGAWVGRDE